MVRKSILPIALFIFASLPAFAQKWIPESLGQTTILVERFKYHDPSYTLTDIDDFYEDDRDDFVENANAQLDALNQKLEKVFTAYKYPYELVSRGKLDEKYPDKTKHRFFLDREIFFGNKKAYNPNTKKVEDQSYFAYRYRFVDRLNGTEYPPYFFSGDQWSQVKRLIFWLNRAGDSLSKN